MRMYLTLRSSRYEFRVTVVLSLRGSSRGECSSTVSKYFARGLLGLLARGDIWTNGERKNFVRVSRWTSEEQTRRDSRNKVR